LLGISRVRVVGEIGCLVRHGVGGERLGRLTYVVRYAYGWGAKGLQMGCWEGGASGFVRWPVACGLNGGVIFVDLNSAEW
jgi:hypothetical protein